MIVCSCFGTTDREIREAYGRDAGGRCPAGEGCGSCRDTVRRIVEHLDQVAQTPAENPGNEHRALPQRRQSL